MEKLGGGAEGHARSKQYEYRANSSLVLTSENPPPREPTGEPETLWGKMDPKSFGDRVAKGRRPQELEDRLKKSKKKERDVGDDTASSRWSKRRRLRREESVLTDTDGDGVVYQPKTKETRAAYEAFLSVIQKQLGGLPLSIAGGFADEILALLKNDALRNVEKKVEIKKLLRTEHDQINQVFDQLVSVGKLITDFQEGGDSVYGNANEGEGVDDVTVEIGDSEEDDEESDADVVVPVEEDEEDEEPQKTGGVQVDAGINKEDAGDAGEGTSLNVQDIGAYWLQRKISQAYEQQIDPQQCQVLAEDLLKILAEGDNMEVENKLVRHLQYEKFSLVKFLLRNRFKIVWCTRLARAKDQEERDRIEEEMRGLGLELAGIVEQLHATRATAKEREEKVQKIINEEAGRLKDGGGRGRRDVADRDLESGWLKGHRQILDLESLAF